MHFMFIAYMKVRTNNWQSYKLVSRISQGYYYYMQARSLPDESSAAKRTDASLWQPKEGTRAEWMACHGMPKDACERTKIKKQELTKLLAKKFGLEQMLNVSTKNL